MSPREAAEATGVNKLTLLKWIKAGRLAAERISTPNGPGYNIRPEDLTQALQAPRKKKDPTPKPVRGSVVDELQTMKEMIERQGIEAERREEAMRAELHDLRAQLHQTETRLSDALRALPARSSEPTEQPATPRPGFFARLFGGKA
jgi:excisionase family DNA binding protein